MKKGISAVILAYNEAENLNILLPELAKSLQSTGEEFDILIIDTHEPTDNTSEVCEKYGAKYFNQPGKGFADAFRCGIDKADRERFLILDGDGSHDPKYIPEIYEKHAKENCDVVIGSRYVKGGKTQDKLSSVIMSRALNFAFRVCMGIKARDLSTDYRMYRTAQLKEAELSCENYDVLEEVLLKLKLNNGELKIGEVPIEFKKRVFGESKRRLWDFIKSYIGTLFSLFGMRLKANKEFFKNLFLYGIFGGVAAGIDYGVFALLYGLLDAPPVVANIAGAVCGFVFTFLANTFFNFKKTTKILRRLVSYGIICLIGMGISTGTLKLLGNPSNMFWLKLLMLIIVSLIQFFLNRRFTYGDGRGEKRKPKKLSDKSAFYLGLIGIAAAAFVIMLALASKRSFWMDDVFQIDMSWQNSLGDMLSRILTADNNPPLSHFLTYIWIRIMPYGTVGLKLFNIILTSLGIYVAGLAARRLRGDRAGILTAVFGVFTTTIVTLAAYTFRPYGLLFLLSALSAYVFILYRKKGRSAKHFILLSLCLTAMVYTHYFGALIIAVMFAGDAVICLKKRAKPIVLLPYIISAAAFLPWFLLVREQSMDRVATFTQGRLNFISIISMFDSLTASSLLRTLYIVCAAALVARSVSRENSLRDDMGAVLAVVPMCVVIINVLIVNYTSMRIYFLERYHIGAIPMIILSVGLGADMLCAFLCENKSENTRRIFGRVVSAALAVFALIHMYTFIYRDQQGYREPFEECADYIMENEEAIFSEDSLIFCTNYNSPKGMEYFMTHKGEREAPDIEWFSLSKETLAGVNRVFVLTLHRPLSEEDALLLEQEGFVLEYQNEILPVGIYAR